MLTVPGEVMQALRRQQQRQALWASIAGDKWNNADNLVFTNEFGRYEVSVKPVHGLQIRLQI